MARMLRAEPTGGFRKSVPLLFGWISLSYLCTETQSYISLRCIGELEYVHQGPVDGNQDQIAFTSCLVLARPISKHISLRIQMCHEAWSMKFYLCPSGEIFKSLTGLHGHSFLRYIYVTAIDPQGKLWSWNMWWVKGSLCGLFVTTLSEHKKPMREHRRTSGIPATWNLSVSKRSMGHFLI